MRLVSATLNSLQLMTKFAEILYWSPSTGQTWCYVLETQKQDISQPARGLRASFSSQMTVLLWQKQAPLSGCYTWALPTISASQSGTPVWILKSVRKTELLGNLDIPAVCPCMISGPEKQSVHNVWGHLQALDCLDLNLVTALPNHVTQRSSLHLKTMTVSVFTGLIWGPSGVRANTSIFRVICEFFTSCICVHQMCTLVLAEEGTGSPGTVGTPWMTVSHRPWVLYNSNKYS